MSSGRAPAAHATRIVCARSAAEIPVVTPSAASIDTVKLVPWRDRFIGVIGARPSCRARSSVIGMHTRPRPNVAMKLTISGVTTSAATTRSPSFSRCSSSTSIAIRPALSSAMISGIGLMEGEAGADPDEARTLSMACSFGAVILAQSFCRGTANEQRQHYTCCDASRLPSPFATSLAVEHGHGRCEKLALRIGKLAQYTEVVFARNEKRPVTLPWTTARPTLPQATALANEFAGLVGTRCQQERHVEPGIEMDRTELTRALRVESEIAVERHL